MSDNFTFTDPVTAGSSIYSWDDPDNWSTGTVANGSSIEAVLGGYVSPPYTVAIAGDYTVSLLAGYESSAQVWVDGGTLTILSAYYGFGDPYGGGFIVSNDGLFDIATDEAFYNGLTLEAAGTVEVASLGGMLDVYGYSDSLLDGTVTGPGTLQIDGDNVTIGPDAALEQSGLTLDSHATLMLAGDASYAGSFEANDIGTLGGNTLELTGSVGLLANIGTTGDTGRVVLGEAGGTTIGIASGGPFEPSYLGVYGDDQLEIASSATQTGYLYLGNGSTDAAALIVDAGADYTMSGAQYIGWFDIPSRGSIVNDGSFVIAAGTAQASIASLLDNDGALTLASGMLNIGGNISGSGQIIDEGAMLILSGSVAAGQDIEFSGTGGVLELLALSSAAPQAFAGTIGGFAPGNFIDLLDIPYNAPVSTTLDYATDRLTVSTGGDNYTLQLSGDFTGETIQAIPTPDDTTTTRLEVTAICYLAGTRILTTTGEVAVEDLRIGDAVETRFAGARRIKWIGRQSFDRRFIRNSRAQIPVRICAGALGEDMPRRDLFVSPGHSMLIGGVLVLARDLVNGVTIRQDAPPDEVHYYQLELETHDCVLAEGAWSETYADAPGMRNAFHNVAEFWQLYPGHVAVDDLCLCAPRPEAGPALEAALRPIAARAAAIAPVGELHGWVEEITESGYIRGWAHDAASPELPVLLDVLCGGKIMHNMLARGHRGDLAAAGYGTGRCAFALTLPRLRGRNAADITIRRAADATELPRTHELQATRRRG